jgi:ATP-binding cassette, subfamily B, multidrug efflux pump
MSAPHTHKPVRSRSDGQLVRRLARELRTQAGTAGLAFALYAPITALQVSMPFVLGKAVDLGLRAKDLSSLTQWSAVFMAVVVLRTAFEALQSVWMQQLGQNAVRALREQLFAKLLRLPAAFFDRQPMGKLITRVTNDTENVGELFSSGSVSLLGDLLFLLFTFVALFVVDVRLTLWSMVTIPLLVMGVQFFRVRARLAFAAVRAAVAQLNATLQEVISGMIIVQLTHQEPRVTARFEKDNRAYLTANQDAIFADAGVYSFVDALATITLAVVLWAGAARMTAGNNDIMTVGVLVAFIDALTRFFLPIRELSSKTTILQNALVAADRIVDLEEEPELVQEAQAHVSSFSHSLSFTDVTFAYGSGNAGALNGISFTVKPGERVAFVGHTGAGKSTLLKLVPRFYDVTGGKIELDGVDVRSLDVRALRKLMATVPQEVFLFEGTLRDNLRFGSGDANDETLLAAAQACGAMAVITSHGGLDGAVKERGQNLSLGERQLLAFARALVADRPLLVLDEATASVDPDTEQKLQRATERLLQGRTALIVAHRLSTIESCDRIYVLHGGKITEQGSHAELMTRNGRYAALVALQRAKGAVAPAA